MTPVVESPASVPMLSGVSAGGAALSRIALGKQPLLIRDAAVEPTGLGLPSGAVEFVFDPIADPDPIAGALAAGRGTTAVIALGGGSTMDAAKIVRLMLDAPHLSGPLRSLCARSGFVRLPDTRGVTRGRTPLVTIPTTWGTGSEVSSVACLVTPWGRRLLSGGQLRPELAALDPAHTATLPAVLQREGMLEVILRVVGPAVGSGTAFGADHEAEAIVRGAAQLAEQLRFVHLGPQERLHAAQLSAQTHRGWALVGRESYAAKHWYLANELSWVTGSRKIPATVSILPALWRRIRDGDRRWGSHERLMVTWSWLRSAVPVLPGDPVDGLRALLDRWGLSGIEAPSASSLVHTAERVHTSWGGTLPALARMESRTILELFIESFPRSRSAHPRPRREVSRI